MLDINFIESVQERDIDLLLLEEFSVSKKFSDWFYKRITNEIESSKAIKAIHSLTEPIYGESDLVIIFENRTALLIEDKIGADAQPDQGDRYYIRGDIGVKKDYWNKYYTCIVAPKLYLENDDESIIYQSTVSYEEIMEYFKTFETDRRSEYKIMLLKEAIDQNRRGYSPVIDINVTSFWDNYWKIASKYFPNLQMKEPGNKPARADWPIFKPSVFNNRLSIIHKLSKGVVDLQISGASEQIEELDNQLKNLSNYQEFEVVKTNKSASVRIKASIINKNESFEEQKEKVLQGLNAANLLFEVGKKIQKKI